MPELKEGEIITAVRGTVMAVNAQDQTRYYRRERRPDRARFVEVQGARITIQPHAKPGEEDFELDSMDFDVTPERARDLRVGMEVAIEIKVLR